MNKLGCILRPASIRIELGTGRGLLATRPEAKGQSDCRTGKPAARTCVLSGEVPTIATTHRVGRDGLRWQSLSKSGLHGIDLFLAVQNRSLIPPPSLSRDGPDSAHLILETNAEFDSHST